MYVRFIQDRVTVEEVPQVFKAGQVYELTPESCERWIRRGVAVAVSQDAPPEQPADAEPPKRRKGK